MASEIARAFGARRVLLLCAILLGARLITLPLYPLFDRTESRYAEIAREMQVTRDWVTPHLHGEPFWGKPPLSTWTQAAGIAVFGRNELAVRLPAWLVGLLTVWLVWRAGLLLGSRYLAAGGALLFCCSPITLFMFGGVMTDPFLGLGTMLAFYGLLARAVPPPEERAGPWRSALTVALGLGIATLAKGPLGVVLGGCAFVGLLFGRQGRQVLLAWPWLRTVGLFALITLPWYLAAEARTPGFLEYFIVGEHIQRYLDSDWSGDRYGFAHAEPMGMIWVHALIAAVAWLPLMWGVLSRERKAIGLGALGRHPGWAAAATATFLPLVFFTFSGNILPTYVYPALAPAALLLSFGIERGIGRSRLLQHGARGIPIVTCAVVLCIVVALPFVPTRLWVQQSHRDIVAGISVPMIVYSRDLDFVYSPIFYSDGRAVGVRGHDDPRWDEVRGKPRDAVVVTKKRHMARIPRDILDRLELERDVEGYYQVWRIKPAAE